jgi:adenylate kinase
VSLDLLLFGPPGAGKGTQAAALARAAAIPHIATGDMFRAHREAGTPLGREAEGYMARGDLVPDSVTIGMLEQRLAEPDAAAGFLLDGFPRNDVQAGALDELLASRGRAVSGLLSIEVPEDELVRRLGGRLVCRAASHPYHETDAPPRRPGVCDIDGTELYRRKDDEPETIRARYGVFVSQTAPVLERYRAGGTPIVSIDGARDRDAVERDLLAAVSELQSRNGGRA